MKCRATSKRTGRPCGRHATPGRRTCRFHGGSCRQPIGPQHPSWRTGLHSKYLPGALKRMAQEIARDPSLVDARPDAARLTALLMRKFSEMDTSAQLLPRDQAEVIALTEARVRAVDRVQRQTKLDGEIVTLAEVQRFQGALVRTLRARVTDEQVLRAIQRDLVEIGRRTGWLFDDDPEAASS
jgi:hypothetical protein